MAHTSKREVIANIFTALEGRGALDTNLGELREFKDGVQISGETEMTFCEMHKKGGGCPECPNRWVCINSTLDKEEMQ